MTVFAHHMSSFRVDPARTFCDNSRPFGTHGANGVPAIHPGENAVEDTT